MTNRSLPQGAPKRPSRRLTLAGEPRDQKILLNRLARELRRIERAHLREIQKVRSAIKGLACAPDTDDLGIPKALRSAVTLDAVDVVGENEEVARLVGQLLGVDNGLIYGVLRGEKIRPAASEIVNVDDKPKLSAEAALAEAIGIARAAEDAAIEIDWSVNPATEREKQLRAAIIRHIELEQAKHWTYSDGTSRVANWTLWHLENLAPWDADEIGGDLYDATERWREAEIEERRRNDEIERKRLLDAARRGLGSSSGAQP
jgi:hypothetical protein